MKVVDFLSPDAIIPALAGVGKSAVLIEMAAFLAARKSEDDAVDAEALCRTLEEREQLASTGIGDGIAIPHGKLETIDHLIGVLGRSPDGVDFDSIDGKKTHIVFLLVAPANSASDHLQALARLSRLFRDTALRQRLLEAADGATMYRIIAEEDAKH
jgi:PTS system nitrogen regulatory IIA component